MHGRSGAPSFLQKAPHLFLRVGSTGPGGSPQESSGLGCRSLGVEEFRGLGVEGLRGYSGLGVRGLGLQFQSLRFRFRVYRVRRHDFCRSLAFARISFRLETSTSWTGFRV